jgi:hypothetical protein
VPGPSGPGRTGPRQSQPSPLPYSPNLVEGCSPKSVPPILHKFGLMDQLWRVFKGQLRGAEFTAVLRWLQPPLCERGLGHLLD